MSFNLQPGSQIAHSLHTSPPLSRSTCAECGEPFLGDEERIAVDRLQWHQECAGVPAGTPLSLDLSEGRHVALGCLECHAEEGIGEVRGTLAVASPIRWYTVEIQCDSCLEPLTPAFDQFSGRIK